MSALDLFLNICALLLWLNWWSRGWTASRTSAIALVSTLRRAEPDRRDRWRSPALLVSIVLLRSLVYWRFGPAAHWTPRLSLVAITVPFRSDSGGRMLLYSVLSFIVFMAGFYFCVLLLSAVNRNLPANDHWQSFVRSLLGPLDRLPAFVKLLLPFAIGVVFWLSIGPVLSWAGVQISAKAFFQRVEIGCLIGVGAWVAWKYVIAAVLVLHIVTSYVYFGNAAIWQFVANTAQNLVRPLSVFPLRISRFDFAPLLVLAAVFAAAELLERWLPLVYARVAL